MSIEKELFDLRWKIESKQNLISSGVITNSITLKRTERDINRWKKELRELTIKK